MKYTIEGFSQVKLIEYGLDNTDALILRWYVDFLPKMATISQDGKLYQWVKYQAIIDDLPCIGINNKQVIARRFTKFADCGIMEKYVHKDSGIFTCFSLTKKYLTLVGKSDESLPKVDLSTKKLIPPSTQKLIGVDSKVDTPINLKVDTKDSSININSSIILNRCISENEEIIKYYNTKNIVKIKLDNEKVNSQLDQVFKNGYSEEDVKLVIDFITSNPWHLDNRAAGLINITRPTLFAEKLEKSQQKTPPKSHNNQTSPKKEMRYSRIDSQYQVAIDGDWMPVSMGEFTEEKAQELLTKYNAILVESKF